MKTVMIDNACFFVLEIFILNNFKMIQKILFYIFIFLTRYFYALIYIYIYIYIYCILEH